MGEFFPSIGQGIGMEVGGETYDGQLPFGMDMAEVLPAEPLNLAQGRGITITPHPTGQDTCINDGASGS
jgi:hypothetical protein